MNDKKMAIISILLIISITLSFLFANNSFNFENNLIGDAILIEETEREINRRTYDFSSINDEEKNCEPICPLGYKVLNSTCSSVNLTCKGNVFCGFFVNDTLSNITNGNCARLDIVR